MSNKPQNTEPDLSTGVQNKENAEKATRETLESLGTSVKNSHHSEAFGVAVDLGLTYLDETSDKLMQLTQSAPVVLPGQTRAMSEIGSFSPATVGPAIGHALFASAVALNLVAGLDSISKVAVEQREKTGRPLAPENFAVRDEYHKQLLLAGTVAVMSAGAIVAGAPAIVVAAPIAAAGLVLDKYYPNIIQGLQNGLASVELIPDIISQQVHLLKEDFGTTLDKIHATTPKSIYESLTPQSAEKVSQFLHGINGFVGDAIDLKNSPEGLSADRLKSLVDYHVHQITGSEGVCPAHPLGSLGIGSSPMNRKLPTFIDNIIEPVPQTITPLQFGPKGEDLFKVLPSSHRSMAPGADEMGNRSEIKRIAIERTGLIANDPRNDIPTLLNENKWRPMGHLLILADGTVQGPEQGAIPFENNPRIAAGKNGETLGVMYAGQGEMNHAQAATLALVSDSLRNMRFQEGLPKDIEIIAGSTGTAEILNLPTPRGPLASTAPAQPTPQLQHRQSNGMGGF